MDINVVNKQIYHNIDIETKSINFSNYKSDINDDLLWKQFIIYSFLSLYKISDRECIDNLLKGKLNYITYDEFNNLIHNSNVEMNFMIDDISESQYRALNDFLFNNKNIIGKCYSTDIKNCKQKINILNKKIKYDNIKS